MVKKYILWTVYALIVGLLIFGAANRTSAKTDGGPLLGSLDENDNGRDPGNNGSSGMEGYADYAVDEHDETINLQDWVEYNGQIAQITSEAIEIQTTTAGILEIKGRPWRFLQELGYLPQAGNQLVIRGFYENGEFEPAAIQDLTADRNFQIRDEYGRPMWGGGGRN